MQAPDFWQHGKGGILAHLLAPLGWLYGFATQVKLATTKPWQSPVPVLCVGNLIAGGAGKTPVALDIGKRLLARGKNVHFLSRGYGGSEKGPLLVDPERHDHTKVGDEPLLLAALAPTWISRERRAGCAAAAQAGADLIIMDDGFQNPYIAKNFSIIVVNGGYGFGNSRMIPAGPLRENISAGLGRANACVVIGEDTTDVSETVSSSGLVPLHAELVPDTSLDDIAKGPVVAFAGIGQPSKFFKTLSDNGCDLISGIGFADHHPYTDADIATLRDTALKAGARLLTTAKDAQRLPPSFVDEVSIVTVALKWRDETALETLLDDIINA